MRNEHKNDEVLLRIAKAVADDAPVNWESEKASHGDLNPKLDRLRLIQSIGSAHRALRTEVEVSEASSESVGAAEPAASPRQWGSLEILEKLGSGGFGEVYRAHDPKLDIDVALKLASVDRLANVDRFLSEARRLARVRHANVLVVHGADRHDGRVGLWTELLRGQTLEECLEQQGAFGAGEAAVIGLDLCRALAAVHAAGLVHRDVKTANVIREEGGRIVLLDFGAVVESDTQGDGDDGIGVMSGTPRFMAPEIFNGQHADSRSDVYSLGVVLYRLVSNRYPVQAESLAELSEKHRRGQFTPLRDVRPDLPAAFVQVVERALAADPSSRFASAGQFESALAAAGGLPLAEEHPPSATRRLVITFAALVVLAVAVWLAVRGPGTPPLEVDAALYRRLTGRSEERLRDGGRVRVGDALFLEIEGTREMHVYVVNEDEHGTGFLLFPLPVLELQNPLPPHLRHRLPAVHREWQVTSAGDRERFLVIASVAPRPELESMLADLPRAGSETPIELPGGIVGRLRGIGGLIEEAGSESGEGPGLSDLEGLISIQTAESQGVWVWEMRLTNPSG